MYAAVAMINLLSVCCVLILVHSLLFRLFIEPQTVAFDELFLVTCLHELGGDALLLFRLTHQAFHKQLVPLRILNQ